MGISRRRSQLRAYFAGLFDGEGCVRIVAPTPSQPRRWRLRASIVMTDAEGLALLKAEYPKAKIRRRKTKPNWTDPWEATFIDNDAYDFLRDIRDYTLVKHEQIKVALAFQVHKRKLLATKGREKRTPTDTRRFQRLHDALRSMKTEHRSWDEAAEFLGEHGLRNYRASALEVRQDIEAAQNS